MKIATAYDAYWFLYEHPKMQCREALILTAEHSAVLDKGERIRTVKDEMPWLPDATYQIREFKFTRRALDMNLDVFYTKVDEKRRVNDDPKKNKFVACWLEFGTIRQAVTNGELHIQTYHDIKLDCGAPTFDEALVKLARLVRKHYGDFKLKSKGSK